MLKLEHLLLALFLSCLVGIGWAIYAERVALLEAHDFNDRPAQSDFRRIVGTHCRIGGPEDTIVCDVP